jgi:hypothetical protein
LEAIFNEVIPVRSLSRSNILSKYSFPDFDKPRNSSNSDENPLEIEFPFNTLTGASSLSVSFIFSRSKSQLSSESPICFKDALLQFVAIDFIGVIASKEFLSE